MELNERIIQEALTWQGVPHVHRGTTKRGADCTGFIIGVIRALGYGGYKIRKYPKDWNLHDMADDFIIKELSKYSNLISR